MLYILHGHDGYSLYQSLGEIKKGLGDPSLLGINTTVLDGQQMTIDQLRSACETVPFMTPKRLVIIEGLLRKFEPKVRASAQKNTAKSTKQSEDFGKIIDCIKRIPDSTVLVLVDEVPVNERQIKASNPLLKELSGKAVVKAFALLRGKVLHQWVQKCVSDKKGTISADAINLMAELVGSNLRVMANELDKLILFTSGHTITDKDVKTVVSHAREFNVFDMVDAILESNPSKAGQSLEQLLQEGESAASLLVRLSSQVRWIFLTKDMKSRGMRESEIQSKLGITAQFTWYKVQNHATRHSLERLEAVYHKLLETDLAIKTGKYDDELALDILIAELCQHGVKQATT